jgi:predicted SpoU family rRNA methylase
MQLSFSTADVENSIFHTAEYSPPIVNQPIGNVTLLAVHGDFFVLQDDAPQESIPFTEKSELFRIVGLDQQP